MWTLIQEERDASHVVGSGVGSVAVGLALSWSVEEVQGLGLWLVKYRGWRRNEPFEYLYG